MSDFIISPYAISFESIKNNLKDYVASKPENETWLDFYNSSAGETILEIAAALGTFYAFHFIVGRRESFLASAENYTSLVGLAENLGYSTSRGTNLKVTINIVPNQTVTLPKWSILGNYTEYDIILAEDTILNEGIATDVPVIIGNLLEEKQRVTTNKLMQFTFLNKNVTNDCRLLLNDDVVPISNQIKDALTDHYVIISNVYGAVDTFYLQQGTHQYFAGDDLTLQFVERNNLEYKDFSSSNINMYYANQVNEVKLLKERTDKESAESIKNKAPLYHETSMVIRSRKDYSKYLKLRNPLIIEANDMDIYPGLIAITYIKEDGTNLTEEEKQYWLDEIEESRPSGVAHAIITDSNTINKKLNIDLWKAQGKTIDTTIGETIDKILKNYENKFDIHLDLNQIEHDIEELDSIKIARVNLDTKNRLATTIYSLYETSFIEDTEFYVSSFIYSTGNHEPTWPTKTGETVIDGDVIWKKVNEYQGLAVLTWEPNRETKQYDYIRVEKQLETGDKHTDIFICDGYVNKSGKHEPEWGKEYVNDNQVVWELMHGTYELETKWKQETVYKIGDLIKNHAGVYRCSNYRNTTGSGTPTLEDIDNGRLIDGKVVWSIMDTANRAITLGWNEHIKLDKVITIKG